MVQGKISSSRSKSSNIKIRIRTRMERVQNKGWNTFYVVSYGTHVVKLH